MQESLRVNWTKLSDGKRLRRHRSAQQRAIGIVPIGNDAVVMSDDTDAFAFKLTTKVPTSSLSHADNDGEADNKDFAGANMASEGEL